MSAPVWEIVYHGVIRRLRSPETKRANRLVSVDNDGLQNTVHGSGLAPKQRKAKQGFLSASVSPCENAFEILTSAAEVALAET
jgi:hypothetical protein